MQLGGRSFGNGPDAFARLHQHIRGMVNDAGGPGTADDLEIELDCDYDLQLRTTSCGQSRPSPATSKTASRTSSSSASSSRRRRAEYKPGHPGRPHCGGCRMGPAMLQTRMVRLYTYARG